ncbi:MAG: hypothetical protein ACOYNI_03595 [Acidimicrobiia bacterium]
MEHTENADEYQWVQQHLDGDDAVADLVVAAIHDAVNQRVRTALAGIDPAARVDEAELDNSEDVLARVGSLVITARTEVEGDWVSNAQLELARLEDVRNLVEAGDRGDLAHTVAAAAELLESDSPLAVRVGAAAMLALNDGDDIDANVVIFAAIAAQQGLTLVAERSYQELGRPVPAAVRKSLDLSRQVSYALSTVQTVGESLIEGMLRKGGISRGIDD